MEIVKHFYATRLEIPSPSPTLIGLDCSTKSTVCRSGSDARPMGHVARVTDEIAGSSKRPHWIGWCS